MEEYLRRRYCSLLRFSIRFRGDIRHRKSTPRYSATPRMLLRGGTDSAICGTYLRTAPPLIKIKMICDHMYHFAELQQWGFLESQPVRSYTFGEWIIYPCT
jgi:hypothetical protein